MSVGPYPVVVTTPDVVGERMAGPGIRAWHFARELARHVPTAVVAKTEGELPGSQVPVLPAGSPEARTAMREAAVLVGQPARRFRRRRRGQKMVYDLFDPAVLELRELYGERPSLRQRIHLAAEWWRLSDALIDADLLIAAAPNQRRFYEQLRPGDAPWVEVPFGVDPDEVVPGPAQRQDVVVWGGGVWEWLDPATAVEAVARLRRSGLPVTLLFLGRTRPNRTLVDRRREDRFEQLLLRGGEAVRTNETWVPYRERLSWLRTGKVAIMLHRRTPEAEASIRTRLFDAIASATPVITTAGGFAADLVARERLGIVVPPEDPDAAAAAIRTLLTDDEIWSACVDSLERIRPQYAWEKVTRPLVDAIRPWAT